MAHFQLIHAGLDVAPILAEIEACAWDEHSDRTLRANSPHAQSSDIWLRYFPRESLRDDADFDREGRCVFYPAWHLLPSLQRVVWALMSTLEATELGGCLLTRLPPGGRILPHVDTSWHARHFNRKVYGVLKSNPWCINRCEDEAISFRGGELWSFTNTVPHSVENGGHDERIAAILCFRNESE
jgi:hypothetical protein